MFGRLAATRPVLLDLKFTSGPGVVAHPGCPGPAWHFTADFIWIEHGEWKAVVLDDGLRRAYLDSLALVRGLDFDVLALWGATERGPSCGLVADPIERHARIDAITAGVAAGGTR